MVTPELADVVFAMFITCMLNPFPITFLAQYEDKFLQVLALSEVGASRYSTCLFDGIKILFLINFK